MKVDVSIGELVDKVSILSIKLRKMKSAEKLKNIQKEYDILVKAMVAEGIEVTSAEFLQLEEINLKLWDIEDQIRLKEVTKSFDDAFIELARSVYFINDDRAVAKKEINVKFGADLVEEKEYVEYKGRGKK